MNWLGILFGVVLAVFLVFQVIRLVSNICDMRRKKADPKPSPVGADTDSNESQNLKKEVDE